MSIDTGAASFMAAARCNPTRSLLDNKPVFEQFAVSALKTL